MDSDSIQEKLIKLEIRLRLIARELKSTNEIDIHNAISLFYYMQKAEEIRIFRQKLDAASGRVDHLYSLICRHYKDAFYRWKKDVQWLHRRRKVARRLIQDNE